MHALWFVNFCPLAPPIVLSLRYGSVCMIASLCVLACVPVCVHGWVCACVEAGLSTCMGAREGLSGCQVMRSVFECGISGMACH